MLLGIVLVLLLVPTSPAVADGLSISGAVVDSAGGFVSGGWVVALSLNESGQWQYAAGGPFWDGSYLISSLVPGTYKLQTQCQNSGYVDEWYGGLEVYTHFPEDVDTVVTLTDTSLEGIDFSLNLGLTISGTVAFAGLPQGAQLPEGWITCQSERGFSPSGVPIAADGSYVIRGLPEGVYTVGAHFASSGYLDEWWNDLPVYSHDRADADGVTVTYPDGNATGIDFTLDKGFTISGVVLDSPPAGEEPTPVTDGVVYCITPEGRWLQSASLSGDDPDGLPAGAFVFTGLPPGDYKVRTWCWHGWLS